MYALSKSVSIVSTAAPCCGRGRPSSSGRRRRLGSQKGRHHGWRHSRGSCSGRKSRGRTPGFSHLYQLHRRLRKRDRLLSPIGYAENSSPIFGLSERPTRPSVESFILEKLCWSWDRWEVGKGSGKGLSSLRHSAVLSSLGHLLSRVPQLSNVKFNIINQVVRSYSSTLVVKRGIHVMPSKWLNASNMRQY